MLARRVFHGGSPESGFYRFDANQSYQYRAFGVPGLGFKRGLGDDLVITPYASIMAMPLFPHEVYENIDNMASMGLLGLYGFFESADFTRDRLDLGQPYAIVREYMAHHQGMIMLGLVNYLLDNSMVRRLHSDPAIRSVELLLQEQIPFGAPNQVPESEDVKGLQRGISAPVELFPWAVPLQTSVPQVNLLSNGSYSLLINSAGSGYSRWNDVDLTRWQPDPVTTGGGSWIYLQELELTEPYTPLAGALWSACYQPVPRSPDRVQVTFHPHMVVFRREEDEIVSTLEVIVTAEDPAEIRQLQITNNSSRPRRLRVTSYGEVILAAQATDARHPAFNKMFIQSEYIEELNMLIFLRRKRSSKETPSCLGHMLVYQGTSQESPDGAVLPITFDSDRHHFIGRSRSISNPAALDEPGGLSGSIGATLDPIFSLSKEVRFTAQPLYPFSIYYLCCFIS